MTTETFTCADCGHTRHAAVCEVSVKRRRGLKPCGCETRMSDGMCWRCDADAHVCGACGAPVEHGQAVCAADRARIDAENEERRLARQERETRAREEREARQKLAFPSAQWPPFEINDELWVFEGKVTCWLCHSRIHYGKFGKRWVFERRTDDTGEDDVWCNVCFGTSTGPILQHGVNDAPILHTQAMTQQTNFVLDYIDERLSK